MELMTHKEWPKPIFMSAVDYFSAGTNCIAIKRRGPAPAIPAAMVPKVVGMVLDAKNIADRPTSMVAK